MSVKFSDERLAESHNFCIGFTSWVEVSAALTAADWKTSQAVFEDLFKSEELDDTRIYVWSESQTAFVRSDCAVELISVSLVYMDFTVIVYPCYFESDTSFRLYESFEDSVFFVFWVLFDNWFK